MSSDKDNIFVKAFSAFKNTTRAEKMVLLCAISTMLPYIFSCLLIPFCVGYALFDRKTRKNMFKIKGKVIIAIFLLIMLVPPIIYKRDFSIAVAYCAFLFVLFFLFVRVTYTKKLFDAALDLMVFFSVVPFVYGITEKLILGMDFRSTGGMLNANYFGTIVEFMLVILIYKMVTNPSKAFWYLPFVALNIVNAFLCDCQSLWIAAIGGIFVYLIVGKHKKESFVFLGVGAAIILIGVLIPGILPRLSKMPSTFDTRMSIWLTSLKSIKMYPLFGQGAYTYLVNGRLLGGYPTFHAHSLFLDPIVNYGLVGFTFLIAYCVTWIRDLIRGLKKPQNVQRLALVSGIIAAIAIHGFTDVTIMWVQTAMMVALLVGGIGIEENFKENA